MTHAHAARMLLAHGPLVLREFYAITGWKKTAAWCVLQRLMNDGYVTRRNIDGRRHYALSK